MVLFPCTPIQKLSERAADFLMLSAFFDLDYLLCYYYYSNAAVINVIKHFLSNVLLRVTMENPKIRLSMLHDL